MKYTSLKLMLMLFVAISITSCETYDDFDSDRPTVIGFLGNDGTIQVPDGSSVETDINVFVSDMSSNARTFNVVVSEDSTVSSDNYSFNATVEIAPNEREGTFSFTATDSSLTTEEKTLTFAFDNSDPSYVSGDPITFTITLDE